MTALTALWRSLGDGGTDICRVEKSGGGWRMAGHTLFLQSGEAAALHYNAEMNGRYFTRIDSLRFHYDAPGTGYKAELRFDADGFIRDYPRLRARLA